MIQNAASSKSKTFRILLLSANDPHSYEWHTKILNACARIGRTDVLCLVCDYGKQPTRSYDGTLYIQRIPLLPLSSELIILLADVFSPHMSSYMRYASGLQKLMLRLTGYGASLTQALQPRDKRIGLLSSHIQARLLYKYAKAVSITPSLIVCLDPISLKAGLQFRKSTCWPIVYDDTYASLVDEKQSYPHLLAVRSIISRAIRKETENQPSKEYRHRYQVNRIDPSQPIELGESELDQFLRSSCGLSATK